MSSAQDTGLGKGKHYAVNVPLRDGIDDESYRSVFRPVGFRFFILISHPLSYD